ncbi:hypothetical protein ACWF94_38590 [Streptomyces sp. NPDC055078]
MLAVRSVPGPVGRRVDAFGDVDRNEPVRIAVPVTAYLSFAELLTLLVYTPAVDLEYGDLADDDAVREALRFALASESLLGLAERVGRTMAAYRGELPQGRGVPPLEYIRCVAAAVTRVFGVSA